MKEALFDIVGPDVLDSAWWDVFAGTGAVGIEALSRGAAYARFTDLHRGPLETIGANLQLTGLRGSRGSQASKCLYPAGRPGRPHIRLCICGAAPVSSAMVAGDDGAGCQRRTG